MIPVPSLSCAVLALAPLGEPASAPAPLEGEAARLIPAEAAVVFRLRSVDEGFSLVRKLAAVADEDLGDRTAAEWMSDDIDVPGDTTKIALDAPVYVAFVIGMSGPVPTFVMPASDAAAYAASLEGADGPGGKTWKTVTAGNYVGASQSEAYALEETPSSLVASLPDDTLAMHLDLSGLIGTFRPLIEMGLEQVELQIDSIADMQDMPFDMTPMLEAYLDFGWDFIDSADTLQSSFGETGGDLRASMSLALLEGSPLAGYGSEAQIDLTDFPGSILPESSIVTVAGCDWTTLMDQMGPYIEDILEMYPEEMGGAMQRYMEAAEGAQEHMGPVITASGDLGGEGMRFSYYMQSESPSELVAALQQAIQSLSSEELGIAMGAPTTAEIAGASVVSYSVQADWAKLARMFETEDFDEEDVAAFQGMMDKLYGEGGIDISLAHEGGDVAVLFGGDEAFVRGGIARLGGPRGEVAPDLAHALAAASGGSFGLVYQIDFGRMMSEITSMVAVLGIEDEDVDLIPTSPMPITIWGKFGGRVWGGGAVANLQEIETFAAEARAMSEARIERTKKELEAKIEEVPPEEGEDGEDHEHDEGGEGGGGGEDA